MSVINDSCGNVKSELRRGRVLNKLFNGDHRTFYIELLDQNNLGFIKRSIDIEVLERIMDSPFTVSKLEERTRDQFLAPVCSTRTTFNPPAAFNITHTNTVPSVSI